MVNRYAAFAVTDRANRARALHHFVNLDHTVGGWYSAWHNCATDTLVKRYIALLPSLRIVAGAAQYRKPMQTDALPEPEPIGQRLAA